MGLPGSRGDGGGAPYSREVATFLSSSSSVPPSRTSCASTSAGSLAVPRTDTGRTRAAARGDELDVRGHRRHVLRRRRCLRGCGTGPHQRADQNGQATQTLGISSCVGAFGSHRLDVSHPPDGPPGLLACV